MREPFMAALGIALLSILPGPSNEEAIYPYTTNSIGRDFGYSIPRGVANPAYFSHQARHIPQQFGRFDKRRRYEAQRRVPSYRRIRVKDEVGNPNRRTFRKRLPSKFSTLPTPSQHGRLSRRGRGPHTHVGFPVYVNGRRRKELMGFIIFRRDDEGRRLRLGARRRVQSKSESAEGNSADEPSEENSLEESSEEDTTEVSSEEGSSEESSEEETSSAEGHSEHRYTQDPIRQFTHFISGPGATLTKGLLVAKYTNNPISRRYFGDRYRDIGMNPYDTRRLIHLLSGRDTYVTDDFKKLYRHFNKHLVGKRKEKVILRKNSDERKEGGFYSYLEQESDESSNEKIFEIRTKSEQVYNGGFRKYKVSKESGETDEDDDDDSGDDSDDDDDNDDDGDDDNDDDDGDDDGDDDDGDDDNDDDDDGRDDDGVGDSYPINDDDDNDGDSGGVDDDDDVDDDNDDNNDDDVDDDNDNDNDDDNDDDDDGGDDDNGDIDDDMDGDDDNDDDRKNDDDDNDNDDDDNSADNDSGSDDTDDDERGAYQLANDANIKIVDSKIPSGNVIDFEITDSTKNSTDASGTSAPEIKIEPKSGSSIATSSKKLADTTPLEMGEKETPEKTSDNKEIFVSSGNETNGADNITENSTTKLVAVLQPRTDSENPANEEATKPMGTIEVAPLHPGAPQTDAGIPPTALEPSGSGQEQVEPHGGIKEIPSSDTQKKVGQP